MCLTDIAKSDDKEVEFKVGDKVIVRAGNSRDSKHLDGKTIVIASIEPNDFYKGKKFILPTDTKYNGGIWIDEIEKVEETKSVYEEPSVDVKTVFMVKSGKMQVHYMTNTKKDSVTFTVSGNKSKRVKYEDLDTLIDLLIGLKEAVEGEAA